MQDWKNIVGYEGLYQISSEGLVKREGRFVDVISKYGKPFKYAVPEIILKSSYLMNGYLFIALHKNKSHRQYLVHRLVATAFIPNPENKPQINHKNGIKTDNRVENLEWNTALENMRHCVDTGLYGDRRGSKNPNTILTENDVLKIRELWATNNLKQGVIGKMFGIAGNTVCNIVNNNTWKYTA